MALRSPRRSTGIYRRLLVALVVFGAVVILDLVLFGWLIFRSLSQREIERVLLETRAEAEDIAGRIAERAERQGADLYTVMAVERETRTYIDSVLRQRGVVSSVEVYDDDDALVYQARAEVVEPVGSGEVLQLGDRELPGEPGTVRTEEDVRTSEYQVEKPIGDFGVLRIGLSERDLQQRIGELRRDLIGQTATLGAVTLALLLGAFLLIAALLRRGQRLEEQAAEAERLAYVGTLASGLAHEIRNPLNSLSLNMQMLEEELGRNGAARAPTGGRLLEITRGEIARLERLVTDFLSYARPRALEAEEVPAAELLERVRELLQREAGDHRVTLDVEDRSGGATLRVDAAQIRQLLLNLAQNALAAVEETAAPRVLLAAERHGAVVDLLVEDNGRGIPPADLDRVFEIFYSTRKGGTGLGLAIVDRIARNHRGQVTLESEPGRGTRVRVSLPAEGPAAEPKEAEMPLSKSPARASGAP
ncbi:MAG TPA: ATP-binding protein [Thermoanaerobaculia bacterium]|nr:ATP-binding protein [Thermoanaerobaculia bacterium]